MTAPANRYVGTANAAACALHLARLHSAAGEAKPLLELVADAEEFYADWGTDAMPAVPEQ